MRKEKDLRKERVCSESKKRTFQIQKRLDVEKGEKRLLGGSLAWDVEEEEDEQMGSASDDEDLQASEYRRNWTRIWGDTGSFEETTRILPGRFTDHPAPPYSALPCTTVQVFSAKISGISGDLQFPLSVYGVIAARDCVDRKRNIIFNRSRINCQTITKEDPYLVLTGPSRCIVLLDPVLVEVMLKVKGAVECEDRTLNFQAVELRGFGTIDSRLIHESYTSKLSTLELTLGFIVSSVEALVNVRVVNGSLPGAFSIIARTRSCEDTDCGDILLGSCEDNCFNHISLSRSVVSVPVGGELAISFVGPSKEWEESAKVVFKARSNGCITHLLIVGSCALQITVGWSSVSLQ